MSINDEWDNGTGFADVGCALEDRFGSVFRFGLAGGCTNMMSRLEGGVVVNVTDAELPFLTHIDRRTAETGFTIGVYTSEGFENGEPVLLLTRYIDAEGLGDMIAEALDLLKGKAP